MVSPGLQQRRIAADNVFLSDFKSAAAKVKPNDRTMSTQDAEISHFPLSSKKA